MKVKGRAARGARHWCAKLNEQAVREVRRRLGAGESGASVARALGLDRKRVWEIKAGRSWAWLDTGVVA